MFISSNWRLLVLPRTTDGRSFVSVQRPINITRFIFCNLSLFVERWTCRLFAALALSAWHLCTRPQSVSQSVLKFAENKKCALREVAANHIDVANDNILTSHYWVGYPTQKKDRQWFKERISIDIWRIFSAPLLILLFQDGNFFPRKDSFLSNRGPSFYSFLMCIIHSKCSARGHMPSTRYPRGAPKISQFEWYI